MHDIQVRRSHLLDLLAAAGPNAIPQPVEYWWAHLGKLEARVTKIATEDALMDLEEAGLASVGRDPLGIRRFAATPQGVAASKQIKE